MSKKKADQPTKKRNPFEVLREYERRSLIHAVGLPQQAEAEGAWSGIGFRISTSFLVSPIFQVSEILHMPSYATVPGGKDWLMGVANVRGNLVPLVDLKRFMAGEVTEVTDSARVLIAKQDPSGVGLMVDEVFGQRHFVASDDTVVPDEILPYLKPYTTAACTQAERTWSVFDLDILIESQAFRNAAA